MNLFLFLLEVIVGVIAGLAALSILIVVAIVIRHTFCFKHFKWKKPVHVRQKEHKTVCEKCETT